MGRYQALKIDHNQFKQLESSRDVLSAALSIERKFDILMFNFQELINEINRVDESTNEYEPGNLMQSYVLHRGFGVRVTNLLSSARLYVDSVRSDFKRCCLDPNTAKSQIESKFNMFETNNKKYRLIKALRNIAQHTNVPINNVVIERPTNTEPGSKSSVKLFVNKEELLKDRKFDKNVINENGDKIEILDAIFEYVCCLNEVSEYIRNDNSDYVSSSRKLLEKWIAEYSKCEPQFNGTGLCALHRNSNKKIACVKIDTKWDDIRIMLRETNPIRSVVDCF